MDETAFAKWLDDARRLTLAQRGETLRTLAPANASGFKPDEAVPSRSPTPNSEPNQPTSVGCPHCGGDEIRSWGRVTGKPRYRCASCQKTFNALTGTQFANLRYRERWADHIQALMNGETLAKTAERCGVNYTTAFRWRHRFLAAANIGEAPELPGMSEADGALILESFARNRSPKGRRKRSGG